MDGKVACETGDISRELQGGIRWGMEGGDTENPLPWVLRGAMSLRTALRGTCKLNPVENTQQNVWEEEGNVRRCNMIEKPEALKKKGWCKHLVSHGGWGLTGLMIRNLDKATKTKKNVTQRNQKAACPWAYQKHTLSKTSKRKTLKEHRRGTITHREEKR